MNTPTSKTPKVYGYVRLSREDLQGAEATEQKLRDRAQICLELAARHGLTLREEDIVAERASGTSLSKREGLQRLLAMARCGELTHLITPWQDRLTRGDDKDRGAIKSSLRLGNVTLITTEGIMAFDRDFGKNHETMFDVKAAISAHYVRDIIGKRKDADLIRLKQGKRGQTAAAYGYYRVAKKDILAGLYPADQLGTFHVIEEEYVILTEIFQRIQTEKAPEIIRDLNARGVPPPSARRPGLKATRWFSGALYGILRNPFYAGIMAQRSRMELRSVAGTDEIEPRKIRLKPEEYILSEVKGDWRQPIDEETYYSAQNRIEGHKGRRAPRTGLLTGLVHCPNGRSMRIIAGNSYGCDCKERGQGHRGTIISGDRLVPWIQSVINALVENMPEAALPSVPAVPKDRAQVLSQLASVRREVIEKEQQAQDMILREAYFVSLLGRDTYEETARKTRTALDGLRTRLEILEAQAAEPDAGEALTLMQRIRRLGGMSVFWETASDGEKRALIEKSLRRIDLVTPAVRFYTAANVTFWEWAEPFAPDLPPFPKFHIKGNTQNLKQNQNREKPEPEKE